LDSDKNRTIKSFWKSKWLTLALILVDGVGFIFAWLFAYNLRLYLNPKFTKFINPIDVYYRILPVMMIVWYMIIAYYGHYSHREKINALNQLSEIFKSAFVAWIGSMVIAFLFKGFDIGRSVIAISSFFLFIYLYISRTILRVLKRLYTSKGYGLTRVVIIGAGETGEKVKDKILNNPEIGYDLVGFVDIDESKVGNNHLNIPVLGKPSDLLNIIEQYKIEEIFIALPNLSQNELMNLIVHCEHSGVTFKIVSNIFEMITSQVKIGDIDDIPVIKLPSIRMPIGYTIAKRLLDLAVTIILLPFSIIAGIIIAILIKLDSKGPVIFKHLRIGKDGVPFNLFKFRTMYIDVEPYKEAPDSPEDARITNFGKFLRKTSLDELPQIINVINGRMSFVGPRPEMPFIVEKYEEWQKRRLDVKPGITGLWQIVGRKNLPLYKNLEYDFYYIKNQSIWLDIVILFKTVPAVLFGKGAF